MTKPTPLEIAKDILESFEPGIQPYNQNDWWTYPSSHINALCQAFIALDAELSAARTELKEARRVIEFYGNEKLYSPDNFLVGSELMRSDLGETKWSRFT